MLQATLPKQGGEVRASSLTNGPFAARRGAVRTTNQAQAAVLSKSRKPIHKKPSEGFPRVSNWVQGLDLNQRPSGYEPDELPGCSTLQQKGGGSSSARSVLSTPFSRFPGIRACQSRARTVCWPALSVDGFHPFRGQCQYKPTKPNQIHRSQGGPLADLCLARYIDHHAHQHHS